MSRPRVIFFGTPSLAVPFLRALHRVAEIVLVITKPPAATGRGQIEILSPVHREANNLGLTVITPTTIKDDAFSTALKRLRPDVGLLVAYGKIIPEDILALPPHGILNIHPSLLPKHRGPSPIVNSILAGDTVTGVTLMKLDNAMDHGPILAQAQTNILPNEYYPSLEQRLIKLGLEILENSLVPYLDGRLLPREQDHSKATYSPILTKDDGHIQWHQSGEQILRCIRAYQPWPGTYTHYQNLRLRILEASISPLRPQAPGTVLVEKNSMIIGTGTAPLRIDRLQPANKKAMTGSEFIRGHATIQSAVLD